MTVLNQNSGYGQAMLAALAHTLGTPTLGKIFVVVSTSDTYTDRIGDVMKPDEDGDVRYFSSLSAAYDAVVSDRNDVILLNGNTDHTVTSMLSMTKNRVHFVGMNGRGSHYGAGAKIHYSGTTGATNIATVHNTGIRCTFSNIKFINDSVITESRYAFAEGGEYTRFYNCEFYQAGHLTDTAAAEFLHNGDSTQFYSCTFGSSANTIPTAKIRPNVLVTATLSGKKCRDTYFENCLFLSKSDGTAYANVYGANATDVERMFMMKDCTFFNNPLSAATPAYAVGFGAAQTVGAVVLKNCTSVDHTVMAQASVGIYVDGAVPTFATSGVSVAS